MIGLEVGQPFMGPRRPLPEGVQLSLSGDTPELHLILSGLTPPELEAITRGQAEFGLYEQEGLLFFLYRFLGAIPWSDTPYSLAREEAVRSVQLQPLGQATRAVLTVILVSSEDAVVRGLRQVTLSPEVTRALWGAVEAQRNAPEAANDEDEREGIYDVLDSDGMAQAGITCVAGT